jgi:hypothetical protein
MLNKKDCKIPNCNKEKVNAFAIISLIETWLLFSFLNFLNCKSSLDAIVTFLIIPNAS